MRSTRATVVIENKVKSIAGPEQIDEYAEKAGSDSVLLLLSLAKPPFFESNSTYTSPNGTWTLVTYDLYLSTLNDLAGRMFCDDPFACSTVDEYRERFLPRMLALSSFAKLSPQDRYDFYTPH